MLRSCGAKLHKHSQSRHWEGNGHSNSRTNDEKSSRKTSLACSQQFILKLAWRKGNIQVNFAFFFLTSWQSIYGCFFSSTTPPLRQSNLATHVNLITKAILFYFLPCFVWSTSRLLILLQREKRQQNKNNAAEATL